MNEFRVDTDGATLVTFWVSVPVSSVQAIEAIAVVSQKPRIRTRRFFAAIHFVAKVSVKRKLEAFQNSVLVFSECEQP